MALMLSRMHASIVMESGVKVEGEDGWGGWVEGRWREDGGMRGDQWSLVLLELGDWRRGGGRKRGERRSEGRARVFIRRAVCGSWGESEFNARAAWIGVVWAGWSLRKRHAGVVTSEVILATCGSRTDPGRFSRTSPKHATRDKGMFVYFIRFHLSLFFARLVYGMKLPV